MSKEYRHTLRWYKQPWSRLAIVAVAVLVFCGAIFSSVISGKTRKEDPKSVAVVPTEATSTAPLLVPRLLDGVLVPRGEEALGTRAVMVENMLDARPLSGLSKASIVIEAPVEGGITRFMALFAATTTVAEVGPIRSARPYYVDWAEGWKAAYFHVGGSPEALDKIRTLDGHFLNIDEMGSGQYFWRAKDRFAPHNTYTSNELMNAATAAAPTSTTVATFLAWHFQDAATTTDRGTDATIKIAYGGVYNVTWKFDAARDVYVRTQAKKTQTDRDGSAVESENVILIKTDAQVLDEKGRLKLRTVGSGEAIIYHDGKRFVARWRRSAGEPIHFESTDGSDYLLTRGRTWIEVTTDDRVFAGLGM